MTKQGKNTTTDSSAVSLEEQQSATNDATVPQRPSLRLGDTMGSSTGEAEFSAVSGGWEGTDDATSTAPSDLAHPPKPVVHRASNVTPEDLPLEELVDGNPLPDSAEFEMGTD